MISSKCDSYWRHYTKECPNKIDLVLKVLKLLLDEFLRPKICSFSCTNRYSEFGPTQPDIFSKSIKTTPPECNEENEKY